MRTSTYNYGRNSNGYRSNEYTNYGEYNNSNNQQQAMFCASMVMRRFQLNHSDAEMIVRGNNVSFRLSNASVHFSLYTNRDSENRINVTFNVTVNDAWMNDWNHRNQILDDYMSEIEYLVNRYYN